MKQTNYVRHSNPSARQVLRYENQNRNVGPLHMAECKLAGHCHGHPARQNRGHWQEALGRCAGIPKHDRRAERSLHTCNFR